MTEPFVSSHSGMQMWFDESGYWRDTGKLMPLQDRVNQSLIGADAHAKGWKPAGFANETPAWAQSAIDYYSGPPQRWVAGMPPVITTPLKNLSQEMLDLYFGKTTRNERSKPVGLTKEHVYKVDADGRELSIEGSVRDPRSAYISVLNRKTSRGAAIWLDHADTIPLAINVLGYDRPSAERNAAGPTTYNGHTAHATIPSSQERRDANVALAIDYLRGADIYDQRQAELEAEEKAKAAREWEEKVASERNAREAAARERAAERAKEAYVSAIIEQHQTGVTAESVAKVQAALSAYETARRKAEGLPN